MEESSKDYRPINECIDDFFSKKSPSKSSFDVIADLSRHWEKIVGKDLADLCRLYFFDQQEMMLLCQSSQISFEIRLRERDILKSINDFLREKSPSSLQISSIKTFVHFDRTNEVKDWKNITSSDQSVVVLEQDEEAREKRAYLTPLSLYSDFLTYPSFGQAFDFFR